MKSYAFDRQHPFASEKAINLMFAYLVHTGDMCPKCHHGTRYTSKRWAICRKCGTKIERKEPPK